MAWVGTNLKNPGQKHLTRFIYPIYLGVKSFELINQITVPVLFLIIMIGFYYSLFLPYASSGVSLVFSMDWSYLATANAFIDGISQNAWDTGAGTGIYLTFATYMKKDSKVVSYALITPILNNMISLMMGTDLKYIRKYIRTLNAYWKT